MKENIEYIQAIEKFSEWQAKEALIKIIDKVKNNCNVDTIDLYRILILDNE